MEQKVCHKIETETISLPQSHIDLLKKAISTKRDMEFFEKKGNKILSEIFQNSDWYPACHNDPNKLQCDHCMNCWPVECNTSNCDRVGRCMCPNTDCICLGRY